MASSLVHAFIDKENTATITTGKGRLGSTSGRQILGKTFSSNNSTLDTPRKALGHVNNTPLRTALGNVTNTAKKIHQGSLLKKIPLQSRTPAPQKKGPRIPSTPSLQFSRKKCVKASVQKVETRPFVEDYSEIEYMPDYKQKDDFKINVWESEFPKIFSKSCKWLPSRELFTARKHSEPDFSGLEIEHMPPKEDDVSPLFDMDDFAKGMLDYEPIELPDIDLL
ncbi:uncharacterized protein LOC100374603 [Saccoglossus kowalevskii]|uniref:Uncharacterized protein LOC100374603 isoform X1 n=1 Tax=Saccoglossus kowalevskii TaxID=10224 RepID=A0ABM0H1W6_SACKO|nr:PREDICTED: uncharacterized protein LOC100374603 isoform X1 [Saccoglossus kowalevskii]